MSSPIGTAVVAMILAGGEGKRLYPLTRDRAKPAVPFGGRYRIIDFVLSNFVNSGIFKISVLTQYKAGSLMQHLARGWQLAPQMGHYVAPVPADDERRAAAGSGAAPTPSSRTSTCSRTSSPRDVCVFGADHIYKMDVCQMLDFHRERGRRRDGRRHPGPGRGDATSSASSTATPSGRIVGFREKPPVDARRDRDAARLDGPLHLHVRARWSARSRADAERTDSTHDFGSDILPAHGRDRAPSVAYDFSTNTIPDMHDGRARLLARRRHHRRVLATPRRT